MSLETILTPIPVAITTLLALALRLWDLFTFQHSNSNPAPNPAIPLLQPDANSLEAEQSDTIQTIKIAVAEAMFRRWGEEEGWSEWRMGIERREYRQEILNG